MLPVSGSCTRVRLESLSSSGLSSAELAPSAIPIERATPQSGRILKVVLRTAASVPKDNAQWADMIGLAQGVHGLVHRTCRQT